MATVGGYSRHYQLAELLQPLQDGSGAWISPADQQARARENLGIDGAIAGELTFANVSAIEGDWRGEGVETLGEALIALQAAVDA